MSKNPKTHEYTARIRWTGNRGTGTSAYKAYERTWDLMSDGKAVVHCSNDPLLGGDPARYNPEDLLIAAVASCHMLWYLHLCANAGVTVLSYEDDPVGLGEGEPSGAGRFLSMTLRPAISITADSDEQAAREIHGKIHRYCFIARSVNFPVHCQPVITKQG